MMNVRAISDAVGIQNFAAALGVRPSAVSNMRSANSIPAKKYAIVCWLCEARGLPEPDRSLFSFDEVASPILFGVADVEPVAKLPDVPHRGPNHAANPADGDGVKEAS
ncbi:hypothetical protein ETW23_05840 [Leisingera sp. NJS201]|uniref:hypothetical protein n=1 Tax=Leisingera sp. NJS201 TaxID=2508306 RepID=UPI00107115FE|nr:hypothetical protein [Leisingera sp. NJS201]QBR35732.1 hypothetical protein ETW23_05840 [Leisingera sp. NJS201]